jgi:hypoxanthine phosphoribosyltransferase
MRMLYSASQIANRVKDLGDEIRRGAGDADIVLLCVLKGAVVFLADLLRAIPGSVRVEFLDKVQDVADTEVADATEIDFLSHCDLRGKNVYLLKDVVSTGVIESYLMNQLRLREPKSLQLVALLDRPELRTVPLEADYAAFTVSKGTFVGYGLEHSGEHVNLDYIATI